jgi:hypothetical protein
MNIVETSSTTAYRALDMTETVDLQILDGLIKVMCSMVEEWQER